MFVNSLLCLFYFTIIWDVSGFRIASFQTNRIKKSSLTKHYTHVSHSPFKLLLLVEPTPFNYVCGYTNRFKETLNHLETIEDQVRIITTDNDPTHPRTYHNFSITTVKGFKCPLYNQVTLSIDTDLKTKEVIKNFRPDLIHVSTPSILAIPAIFWVQMFNIPLVMSYHTDIVKYAQTYLRVPGVKAVTGWCVRLMHKFADLVLCSSPQLKTQMESLGIRRVDVWQKAINTKAFSPQFKSESMRTYLSEGHSSSPLLLFVGRLGAEKKLERLRTVLDANQGARLAIVGSGPAELGLREYFKGYPVHFTGQLVGEDLSRAFASADLFVMPSDTETLGFVVLESMASGVPVVGVAAGGVVDIVQHGKTGFLVSNSDEMEEFSDCVRRLLGDRALRAAMGTQGVEWTEQWSWAAATDRLRNVQYRKAQQLHACRDVWGRHNRASETTIMTAGVQSD